MIHIFHTPTGWKVCQEHPEKPKYPICKDIIHESNYYPCRPDVTECYCRPYLQAVALSIANAVDVREEDLHHLWNSNWFFNSQPHGHDYKDNEIYALPELEMERAWQWFDDLTKKWNDCTGTVYQIFERSGAHKVRIIAHVFRKKEEPKIEESQEELWLEIESIIDKWWDDKNDLRSSAKMVEQDLASKFHLTRVKAELKGEKK